VKITKSLIAKAVIVSVSSGLMLSLLLLWGVGARNVFETFLHASVWLILSYVAVSITVAVGVTYKWHIVLDAYDVHMPFMTLFIFRLIGFAVSYVTPTAHVGGEPVRALLVHRHGIPLKVSFSAVLVDKILEIMFNIGIFFIGALIIINTNSFPLMARATIFVLSLILVMVASVFAYNIVKRKKVFVPLLQRLGFAKLKNWPKMKESANEFELLIEHFYANRKRHFQHSMIVNAVLWALMFIEYKFALLILGYNASPFGIFLFLTGVGIAYSIPIPAGLGVLELGQISAGKLLGLGGAIGVALAFLVRIRDIIWTITGLILLGVFHLDLFKLYTKSQEAGKKYSMEHLHLELSSLYKGLSHELKR